MKTSLVLKSSICAVVAILAVGCASKSVSNKSQIAIEHVDSSSVKIGNTYITERKDGLILRGEVKRKIHSHGNVPGHLHVELLDKEGNLLKTAEIDHNRKASSDHIEDFSTMLPIKLSPGSLVRVIHHDARSHEMESKDTVWQEAVAID